MSKFFVERKKEWEELEGLVKRARRSLRHMTPEELSRLDVLYRETTVHLAQVASRTRDAALLRYLNDLTASAHSVIYARPKSGSKSAWWFVREGFAQAVARTGRYHLAAAGLMLFGVALAYVAAMNDPAAAYAIMPRDEVRMPGSTRDQLEEALQWGRETGSGFRFVFTSFLFTNNLKVGLLSLATGVLCAVPTVLLLVYNGMILGAFTAIHHGSGIYGEYWAWILPHGVTELWAIVLCGGLGLRLGHSVVSPGLLARAESLRRAGIEAAQVCLGVAGMLVFAAFVEGYLRQSSLGTMPRLAFAAATAVFWTAYFLHGALRERQIDQPGRVSHCPASAYNSWMECNQWDIKG